MRCDKITLILIDLHPQNLSQKFQILLRNDLLSISLLPFPEFSIFGWIFFFRSWKFQEKPATVSFLSFTNSTQKKTLYLLSKRNDNVCSGLVQPYHEKLWLKCVCGTAPRVFLLLLFRRWRHISPPSLSKKVAANEHFLPDVLECWEQGQLVQKLAMWVSRVYYYFFFSVYRLSLVGCLVWRGKVSSLSIIDLTNTWQRTGAFLWLPGSSSILY